MPHDLSRPPQVRETITLANRPGAPPMLTNLPAQGLSMPAAAPAPAFDPLLGYSPPAPAPQQPTSGSVFPGAVLMLTSLVVSRAGDWLRDVLDPTLRGES